MNTAIYRALLQSLGKYLQLHDLARFASSGLLEIENMPVVLLYDEAFDPQLLQIRFDLGDSPEEGREALWYALLDSNFIWGEGGRFVFGVCSDTDHVVLTIQHAIAADVTAAELGDWLRGAAREVLARWTEILQAQAPQAMSAESGTAWQHRLKGFTL